MNSIVLQLQEDALDKHIEVADLLRKALVVAKKLEIKDFQDWIMLELNGYQTITSIPLYREVPCRLKVQDPFQGNVPAAITDPVLEKQICNRPLKQSISEVEALTKKDNLSLYMTGQEISMLQDMFETDLNFVLVPYSVSMQKICDQVRTIILDWSLELEKQGILGSGFSFSPDEKKNAVNNSTIHIENFSGVIGNAYNNTITQNFQEIKAGDLSALIQSLSARNIPGADLDELKVAIQQDEKTVTKEKKVGKSVAAWIGQMISKSVNGTISIGSDIAAKILVEAISRYYGF